MLIFSHLPVQFQWQLLHPAVSRHEFESYPLVKSVFFAAGMQFPDHPASGILHTRRGIVTLSIGITRLTTITFRLLYGASGLKTVQVRTELHSGPF